MLQKQSPFINLKNYMLYVLVVHTHIACHGMCIEVNGQLSGVSSLHHAGAGNWIQVIKYNKWIKDVTLPCAQYK